VERWGEGVGGGGVIPLAEQLFLMKITYITVEEYKTDNCMYCRTYSMLKSNLFLFLEKSITLSFLNFSQQSYKFVKN
jgi:hypothetical protein